MIMTVWMAFCAIGAGVLHLALVVTASPVVAVPLGIVGAAELIWAIIALHERPRALHGALAVLVAVPVAWAVVVVAESRGAAPLGMPLETMLAASVLQLVVGALIAVRLRSSRLDAADRPAVRPAGTLALVGSMVVAGVLVGAITTPALSETAAGENARPHGEHLLGELPAPAGHDDH
jgi:hypothetical protein